MMLVERTPLCEGAERCGCASVPTAKENAARSPREDGRDLREIESRTRPPECAVWAQEIDLFSKPQLKRFIWNDILEHTYGGSSHPRNSTASGIEQLQLLRSRFFWT
jgi:hypothetical protein